jgi:hypothetical protein
MVEPEHFLEIDESESKYALNRLNPETDEAINLWHKHVSIYTSRARFWNPRLEMGKKCMDAMRRRIFTPQQRAKYMFTEKKWPIELQLTKKFINTLTSEIKKAVPGADITFEDSTPPENAAKPETFSTVINHVKQQKKILQKNNRVLRSGLITGYPCWLWFDKIRGVSAVPDMIPLIPSVLPWDSTLPEEYFDEDNGIRDLIILHRITKKDLYDTYPTRAATHKRHRELLKRDDGFMERLLGMEKTTTANDRKNSLFKMISEARFNSEGGYYFMMQHVFPNSIKQRVWIDPETYSVFVPPIDWTDQRREMWLNEHQEYHLSSEIPINTLWITTISTDGFIWENNEHWYQEDGELPGVCFIPPMIDNIPTGAVEDALPYVLLASTSMTEGLDQVRRGTSRLTVISEGSIKNVGRVNQELSAAEGVIIAKKGYTPKDAVNSQTRTPNTTFIEFDDKIEEKLWEVYSLNDAMVGRTNPRQSEKAKLRELKQGLSPHGSFVDNWSDYTLREENLLCKLIPLTMTEEMVITIKDEYGQEQEPVTINGEEYDYSGEAHRVVNDIVSARYRAIAAIADNSATSREAQMIVFTDLLEAIGNQLFKLDPTFLGKTFGMFPNIFAREASKFLIEYGQRMEKQQMAIAQSEAQSDAAKQKQRREIEMEKIKRPRITLKLSPEDVENAPEGMKLMYTLMKKYENEALERELRETNNQQVEQQQPEEQPETVAA